MLIPNGISLMFCNTLNIAKDNQIVIEYELMKGILILDKICNWDASLYCFPPYRSYMLYVYKSQGSPLPRLIPASPSMCLISLLSCFFLFGETNQSSVWRLNLWDVSLVLVQQSAASNLPQCCRVATCACCRRCPRSAISCTLPISDGLWGSWATKRLGFLASCAASLSLSLPPFLPAPLRALHSFAQLMKINESKNVACSFPWSRLLFSLALPCFLFLFCAPSTLLCFGCCTLSFILRDAAAATPTGQQKLPPPPPQLLFISKRPQKRRQRRSQREQSRSRGRRRCSLCCP